MKAPTSDAGYTLVSLVNREDARTQLSPYVWKTIIELRFLGVNYTEQRLIFDQIRNDLAKELGDEKVLVPVLKNEGEFIKDSWEIALHLDKIHAVPKGKSLFLHGVGGREFCRFVEYWANTVLAANVGPVVKPRTLASLPPSSPSHAYFLKTRFGTESAWDEALSNSKNPEEAGKYFNECRKALKLINTMLKYQHSQGKKFIGGDFSHADAAVFGWYMWSTQFVVEFKTEVWEHEGNKEVKAWVGDMKGLPGWEEGDFDELKSANDARIGSKGKL